MKKSEGGNDGEFDTATPNTVVLPGGVSIGEARILSGGGPGVAMSRSV